MKTVFMATGFCLVVLTATSQTVTRLDEYTRNQIDNVVNLEMQQSGLPSVSLGVVYNGRVAYTKAFGNATGGIPATTSTKYPIASVSKVITGMIAMRMIQNGDLGLNTTIDNYTFGYNNSNITIRHLLSHQSGIGHYGDCPGGYDGSFNSFSSQLTVMGCSRCMSPPGSGTVYTTFGTTLLGCIVDIVGKNVYNKGYIQLYNEWIRDAAGLTNLTAESGNNISGIATGYDDAGNINVSSWNDIGWKLPAGGFVSTAHDLAGFGAGVMNYSFLDSALSNNTMWVTQNTSGTPTVSCSDGLSGPFGLAFRVSGTGSNLRISHDGLNDHGFSSYLYLYPPKKAGTVLLTNRYKKTGTLKNIIDDIEAIVLCPSKREFTSPINWTGNWVYEASQSIMASNSISSTTSSFVFDAGREVVLKPGFQALAGLKLTALIEGCGGAIKPY